MNQRGHSEDPVYHNTLISARCADALRALDAFEFNALQRPRHPLLILCAQAITIDDSFPKSLKAVRALRFPSRRAQPQILDGSPAAA